MSVALVCCFLKMMLAQEVDEPRSDLPPAASVHNERGVALVYAGQYDEGISELELAYAAMADPLEHRVGRGKVIGSLRSALQARYAATGDVMHLCRLRGLLRRHRDELSAALRSAGRAEVLAGTEGAIRALDGEIAGRSCAPPAAAALGTAAPVKPPPPVEAAPQRPGLRRMRVAGGALLGVGFASLGVMTYGVAAVADNRQKLRSLTATVDASGEPASEAQQAAAAALYERARDRRTLAIVAGALGGVAVITGLALRVAGRSRVGRLARVPVAPVVLPGFAGVAGRFVF